MSLPNAPGIEHPLDAHPHVRPRDEIHVLALIDHLALGGAEMLLSQFAAAAPDAAIRPSVACLCELDGNPAAAALRSTGVVPENLNLPGRPSMRSLLAVRRHVRAVRPDIVHTHLGDADLLGGLAARSAGIPAISTIHTTVFDHGFDTFVKRRLVRLCAARIVAVSEGARRACLSRGFARPDRLVTIRNGVAAEPLPGSGHSLRAEFGWNPDDHVIGMLSALRAVKGHDIAVAAYRRMREQFPALKLLIVGRGPEWDHIESMIQDLGPSVAMAGHRTDVMRCLDAFDVCLHPSHDEALPTTLIEAMAASVPVVATDVGGIPEVIVDGESGILMPAPPSPEGVVSAVASLLRDPARRRALAAAGRTRYQEQFTVGPWLRSTRAMYDEVLAGRRPEAGAPA